MLDTAEYAVSMLLYLSTHNTSTEKKVDGSVHSFYAVNRNFWELLPKSDVWHFSARRHTVPPKNGVPNFGTQFPKRQPATQVTVSNGSRTAFPLCAITVQLIFLNFHRVK